MKYVNLFQNMVHGAILINMNCHNLKSVLLLHAIKLHVHD